MGGTNVFADGGCHIKKYNGEYITNEQMNDRKFLKLAGIQGGQ